MNKRTNDILWYTQPADSWEQGMAIGNGWLGGMVLGGYDEENISLNLDTLWSGYGKDKNIYNNAHHVASARELILNGELEEVDKYISKYLMSEFTETYMPAGDLRIDFHQESQKKESYCRQLDLQQSLTTITYGSHKREIFCSNKDDIMGIRLEDKELNFDLHLTSQLMSDTEIRNNMILLHGIAPTHVEKLNSKKKEVVIYNEQHAGIKFALALVIDTDGKIEQKEESLSVSSASYAKVYLTGDTNFKKEKNYNCIDICEKRLAEKMIMEYSCIRDRHINDYKELYDRVSFHLGDRYAVKNIPTDQLLHQFKEAGEDLSLIPLVFNFGRYLIISGSRENSKAMNLQGIWNRDLRPIWQSNYTVNINTEMNYWPVEMCNLSECHNPLFDLLEDISKTGRITAREHYNCRGWVSHHNIDIWGHTSPVGLNNPTKLVQAAFWPMSSGWLSIHLWDHYLYTEDVNFLEVKALPIMKEAARFYLDWLIEDDNQQLVTIPSTSPENQYMYKGKNISASVSTTMDIAIIRKLFKSTIEGLNILEKDEEFRRDIEKAFNKLRPYTIGKDGRFMEWSKDYEDRDPIHRHVSHLFPLYPSDEITTEATSELAEACKTSLNTRGDDGTGWSIVWKILLWARLKDGDRALKLLKRYLYPMTDTDVNYYNGGVYDSLLCAHPPFQIDGNCGITAAIGEMLIQSHNDYIELLPALPSSWEKGELNGVKSRGNYTVSFTWEKNKVIHFQIDSNKKECSVKVNGEVDRFPCNKLIEVKV